MDTFLSPDVLPKPFKVFAMSMLSASAVTVFC
jgi:hypothetical protein